MFVALLFEFLYLLQIVGVVLSQARDVLYLLIVNLLGFEQLLLSLFNLLVLLLDHVLLLRVTNLEVLSLFLFTLARLFRLLEFARQGSLLLDDTGQLRLKAISTVLSCLLLIQDSQQLLLFILEVVSELLFGLHQLLDRVVL